MRPTHADVEVLAKRLHQLAMKYTADNARETTPWGKTSEFAKARYRFVATDLLTNPPIPLAASEET